MGNLFCCNCAAKCEVVMIAGQNREKCPDCGYIYYRNPSPAVSVIVSDGNRIALGKRADTGNWCLPCGYIEYNESYLDAAIREVQEEIGIPTVPEKIINVVSNQLYSRISSIVIVIVSRPLSFDLSADDDISEAKWFSITDPLPQLEFDADRYIISKYKECLDTQTEISGILLSDRQISFIQE